MTLAIEEESECSEYRTPAANFLGTLSPDGNNNNEKQDIKKISYQANKGASRPSTAANDAKPRV
jgi:hypothetical protein